MDPIIQLETREWTASSEVEIMYTINRRIVYSLRPEISAHLIFRAVNKL
jgi:hypothetical protein